MAFGVDYSSSFPGAAALKAAGVTFIARYLSPGGNPKNITKSEVNACLAAGLAICVVWETTATRILSGFAGGQSDATQADAMVKALGMAGIPIYFACDFDESPGQQAAVNAYLDGVASVIGRARTGIYGGYWPLKRALDAGKAKYGWQTYAWSGGNLDPRAQLYQYSNGHFLGGIQVDFDKSEATDFGQWPRKGVVVKPEDLILRQGATGDAVKYLQTRLNVWGAKLTVDSDFGALTLAAVKAFQTKQKLTVDGVVGPATWSALDKNPTVDPPPANSFPAPTGFALAGRKISVGIKWNAVTAKVNGALPTGYTVQCYQLNGVKVGEQVVTGTSARFDNLTPGFQYNFLVWANGSPVGSPHAQIKLAANPS